MRCITALILVSLLSSCASHSTADYPRPGNGICEVRRIALIRMTVATTFGYVVHDPHYVKAMERYFPHADPYVSGGCDPSLGPRTSVVYVCPECKRARLDWARIHPRNYESEAILESP